MSTSDVADITRAESQRASVKADPKAQLPLLPIHSSIPLAPVTPTEPGTAGRHPPDAG